MVKSEKGANVVIESLCGKKQVLAVDPIQFIYIPFPNVSDIRLICKQAFILFPQGEILRETILRAKSSFIVLIYILTDKRNATDLLCQLF